MTSAASPITVAVVDDHPVFRLGMVALLETLRDVTVVAEAASAAEGAQLPTDGLDVVVMDLQLGDGSGVETTRDLLRRAPHLRVLVVTMHEDDESVVASIRAGAHGYLLKGATPDEVERAVRAVANGELILGARIAARATGHLTGSRTADRHPFPELTLREREVLDLLARGYDTPVISRRLVLSPKTVRNHVASILTKIGAPDRPAAIVLARERGLGHDAPA